MRIGVLTTSFPRYAGDVPGQFVHGFAAALAGRGHTLDVLAPEPSERRSAPGDPGIELHWIRYLWPRVAQRTFYGAGVPDNLRRDPLAWLGALGFPVALFHAAARRLEHSDALVSHWALPCAFVAGAVRGGRPHLAVFHSADVHLLSRLPARPHLCSWLLHNATRLLFVTRAARDRFIAWLPENDREHAAGRCTVQPMGIDAPVAPSEARSALRERLRLDRFALLTLARLVPVKGLCEALAELAHRADLQWLIAGGGPLAEELARRARSVRIEARLLGQVGGAHKRELLHACDALLLPSRVLPSGRSEGAPTVVLEAMAHGLPVIASDVGGIAELVDSPCTGLLVPPDASGALERAVDSLAGDPVLRSRLAERAAAVAQAHYWSALAPKLERLLTSA